MSCYCQPWRLPASASTDTSAAGGVVHRPIAFRSSGDSYQPALRHALAQRRTARDLSAGIFHQSISYGFVVLTIATTVVALDADFGTSIMRGNFYLYFQSFTVDFWRCLVILGVTMAAARRYAQRPKKLVYSHEATLILLAVFVICLQDFCLKAGVLRPPTIHGVHGRLSAI